MALILAGSCRFDVDAVVFDKDGTLVDFATLWGARTVRWVETVAAAAGNPAIAPSLYRLIGFDPQTRQVQPDGPLAVASTADIYSLAAAVLFQHGYGWHEGRPLAERAAAATMAAPPAPEEIQPIGDVAGTFRRLRAAGIKLAIATNDDRALTEATLVQLGIGGDVAVMACGDDPLPAKPHPAALHWIARELETTAARLVMVGDSANDMLAGRNAGVAGCVGILGGAGRRESLEALADVLIDGIDGIVVLA
ncbi:MAG: HAD family hydrolase [Anaerolineae bacterium]|nr:HAD family hydrolase [Anaerolineae bacterium]